MLLFYFNVTVVFNQTPFSSIVIILYYYFVFYLWDCHSEIIAFSFQEGFTKLLLSLAKYLS